MFAEKLGYFAGEFRISVFACCCMPNHFHLYLRTKEANLSRFMQSFLTSFCISSNKKRRTSGHIFQGRFKAHLVEDELYRSRLSRYIHLNPVRIQALRDANLEERHNHLREFKWSSYSSYLGISNPEKWLECAPILSSWGVKKREQMLNYARYVEEGLLKNLENPFDSVVEQSIIGSDRFIDRIKRKYLLQRTGDKNEEHSLVHLQQSFSVDEVINHVSLVLGVKSSLLLKRKSGHRDARRLAMYCVCTYCRNTHSFNDLAQCFSVSASALTQARDKVRDDSSPSFHDVLKKIDNALQEQKT